MTADLENFARRIECEQDGLYFNRYFFKQRFGNRMVVSGHHEVAQSTIDKVISGEITRLIVTMPPGYTKTELFVIGLISRGLALNASSRFLHLSYSHALALLNSSTSRQVVKSEEFQRLWRVETKDDTDSKALWHTTMGGGVYATSAGGQVTGFRAGHMDTGSFSGALIIDDPLKPDDAYSEVAREGVNNRYNETIASRVATEEVPIIVVMQRLHDRDLAGYLLEGGSGEKWHHLDLPVFIDNSGSYPEEYTHGIPIEHGLPDGWLWPFKHDEKHEIALKSHRRKFAAQYMQRPIKRNEETALWKERDINLARSLEEFEPQNTVVSVDPAASNTKTSDEHGIVVVSSCGKDSFSVDADYTRKGSPKEWAIAAIGAYEKHEAAGIVVEINQGGDMCQDTLRNAGYKGKIFPVNATKGKTLRAEPVAALYELRAVKHRSGLSELEEEMLDFDPLTQKSNGRSPNRVDALVHGITHYKKAQPEPRIRML